MAFLFKTSFAKRSSLRYRPGVPKTMFIPNPPELTERAVQQLRTMGLDSSVAFQRMRAIQRSINNLQMSKAALENDIAKLHTEETARAPYAHTTDHAAEYMREIAEAKKRALQKKSSTRSQITALEHEMTEIEAWHPSQNRLLDRVLESLGVKKIEQALPDFDDGFSEDLRRARSAGAQSEISPREFGVKFPGRSG